MGISAWRAQGSVAVNAGWMALGFPAVDIQGRTRVMGKAVDLGCYERGSDAMLILLR